LKKREKKQDDKRSTGNNNNINNRKNRNMSLLGMGLQTMYGEATNRRQQRQQRELMGYQYENQRRLNQQGHDLQMDMWNKTNASAQVKHYKDAGLNPALMYGTSGATGTTGSQSGGSATGGGAPQAPKMDIQSMLMQAQINDLNASAKKKDVEANKLEGVDTKLNENLALESIARAKDLDASAKLKVEQKLKTIIEKDGQVLKNSLDQIKVDKNATGSTFLDMMNSVGLDPTNNEEHKWIVRGIMTAYFGADVISKVARAFPKAVADTILRFFGITPNK
tara:strand:+ start:1641 stop:2477 length:837 start_codon:yes stop_codon:yes gene_type:complete